MATHASILACRIHGQRSLAGYRPWDLKEPDMTEHLTHASVTFFSLITAPSLDLSNYLSTFCLLNLPILAFHIIFELFLQLFRKLKVTSEKKNSIHFSIIFLDEYLSLYRTLNMLYN